MLTMLRSRSRGQGLLEYSLIILFVALVVFGGLLLLGPQVTSVFNNIHSGL
jgi:Flp pilus assembly pilin Flp